MTKIIYKGRIIGEIFDELYQQNLAIKRLLISKNVCTQEEIEDMINSVSVELKIAGE